MSTSGKRGRENQDEEGESDLPSRPDAFVRERNPIQAAIENARLAAAAAKVAAAAATQVAESPLPARYEWATEVSMAEDFARRVLNKLPGEPVSEAELRSVAPSAPTNYPEERASDADLALRRAAAKIQREQGFRTLERPLIPAIVPPTIEPINPPPTPDYNAIDPASGLPIYPRINPEVLVMGNDGKYRFPTRREQREIDAERNRQQRQENRSPPRGNMSPPRIVTKDEPSTAKLRVESVSCPVPSILNKAGEQLNRPKKRQYKLPPGPALPHPAPKIERKGDENTVPDEARPTLVSVTSPAATPPVSVVSQTPQMDATSTQLTLANPGANKVTLPDLSQYCNEKVVFKYDHFTDLHWCAMRMIEKNLSGMTDVNRRKVCTMFRAISQKKQKNPNLKEVIYKEPSLKKLQNLALRSEEMLYHQSAVAFRKKEKGLKATRNSFVGRSHGGYTPKQANDPNRKRPVAVGQTIRARGWFGRLKGMVHKRAQREGLEARGLLTIKQAKKWRLQAGTAGRTSQSAIASGQDRADEVEAEMGGGAE